VPKTVILSGPTGTLPVSFTYASSAGASTFQCQLDAGGWQPCPAGGISYGAVPPGNHTFSVRADLGDPAPPQRTWTQAAPTPVPGSSVPGGTILVAGQYVESPNAQYRLVMQDDGNLVLDTQGRELWSSGTVGHPGATAAFQADGNLVVYGPDGRALWSAGSDGHPGSTLTVQDDGDVVVYAPGGVAVWNTATFADTMTPGTELAAGQYLRSANAQCQLIMQADGNLVLSCGGNTLWTTATFGHPGARVAMQADGNLVVYSPANAALWSSHTDGHPGATLALEDDGSVVVYAPSHQELFARAGFIGS
jgi:hypothetical protein